MSGPLDQPYPLAQQGKSNPSPPPPWIPDDSTDPAPFDTGFHTDWTVIRTAGQSGDAATGALEKLCRVYWYPLYAYVRRQGHGPHDAQDLTQEFFARLLATPWLENLHPSKGRFRSFLLASMNHFLANEWRRGQAQKRGGGQPAFSFDSVQAEDRYRLEPAHNETPDKLFEREWAKTLLERTLAQLRRECALTGKAGLLETLGGIFDSAEERHNYAEVSARLGMTEAAVKKAAQRLRERYRTLLRAEVAGTVDDPAEVDEEARCLFSAWLD